MNTDQQDNQYGVHETVEGLHEGLKRYIEAQYHIRDGALVAERASLLQEPSVIAQQAYVEATAVYALGEPYACLNIPDTAKYALTEITALNQGVGLYPRPYVHQAEALTSFLGEEQADLVVATGTGSGKTESFLMPIIGSLAIENAERKASAELPGCRALLLYPMNALVNDQVARIRRLLGNTQVNEIIRGGRNRPIRFGSYTGRTPYAGTRNEKKDSTHIAPLFDEFYTKLEASPTDKATLEAIGRWPSKDLVGFYAEHAKGDKIVQSGKSKGTVKVALNWNDRLKTQPGDRELMTRDEMQKQCPDILVTNYSMLEYMLMRPIERPLFEQTARWLESDERNQLILVLDEAHMYRGAGGAEVALLIRRLVARLGVSRNRIRCILTSASLGGGPNAAEEIKAFANDLTGAVHGEARQFKVVRGTLEERPTGNQASSEEVNAFAEFHVAEFSSHAVYPLQSLEAVDRLSRALGWHPAPRNPEELPDYLFAQLSSCGPAQRLMTVASGKAVSLQDLTDAIFPDIAADKAQRALDSLLALSAFARRQSDKRTLLPARLHLFFRGLPGLYACVDPACSKRLANTDATILGRFHTKSLLACGCESRGRVYEYLTHRDCGASFLRGWVDKRLNFVWHEPDRLSDSDGQRRLFEIEMLVEDKPQPTSKTRQHWLHVSTGRMVSSRPSGLSGFRSVWLPDKDIEAHKELTFDVCPVCSRKTRQSRVDPSKIMDHVTKGEAPFATLVRGQIQHQPAAKKRTDRLPNQGKKVLVFSDGRQKAARLARDMPRDMELDLFRQTLAIAVDMLSKLGRDARPTTNTLYMAFLAALAKKGLSMFDSESEALDSHVEAYKTNCVDLEDAFEQPHDPGLPSLRYKVALLRLLCSSYYSLTGTTVGFVEPNKTAMKKLVAGYQSLGLGLNDEDIRGLAVGWIQEMLSDFAFDADFPEHARTKAYGFPRASWGGTGKFHKPFRDALASKHSLSDTAAAQMEAQFSTVLAQEREGLFLNPNALRINVDLKKTWFQCTDCTALSPFAFRNGCLDCGSSSVNELDPATDRYLIARKEFWRLPVAEALSDNGRVSNIYVEEHTAQLSNRDHRSVHSTTEKHELRFQDILLDSKERPIDVLSCTTTMEVGIDIGSLVAVALRNVPPQRENYQQRAGRAGRRGASVSSVVTFSQNGPHDSFYFLNPKTMVSGAPRSPELKVQNPKIARRHVNAFLVQTFFTELEHAGSGSAMLQKSLGRTEDFFTGKKDDAPNLHSFERWLSNRVLTAPHTLRDAIAGWLPPNLDVAGVPLLTWVTTIAEQLIAKLKTLSTAIQITSSAEGDADGAEKPELDAQTENEDLLEFLFFHGLLPTYAFPTELCSFLVETRQPNARGFNEIRVEQRPQQSTNQALSEYAPGRLIVINKATYRSGGVFANTPSGELNRARKLFSNPKRLITCMDCSFVHDPHSKGVAPTACPVCNQKLVQQQMIRPEVFGPENARALGEDDRDQDITYATMAQFPQPTNGEDFVFKKGGERLSYTHAVDRRLLTVNKGLTHDGVAKGFSVCADCGCASVFDAIKPRSGKHRRPYLVNSKQATAECNGVFEQVYLGFDFATDLVLLRLRLSPPVVTDLMSRKAVHTLENAAYSIAEALRLAASRHYQLDLDPTEFGAGHRLLPKADKDGDVVLDIYLYDTLAGGAGYSELAEKYFDQILLDTLDVLDNCSCDTSCTECLDHFHNQHLKSRLDRKLASMLLRYALLGQVPQSAATQEQIEQLTPLQKMLELDGYTCRTGTNVGAIVVPLIVEAGQRNVAVLTYPSLIVEPNTVGEIAEDGMVIFLDDSRLRGDVPGIHADIKRRLEG